MDLSSISVPIEKGHYYNGDGYHQQGHGGSGEAGISGPPFIVKLLNLPITANDGFIEDLFKSRFTPFIKFKILTDPISNILETHIIKQVAFVELESAEDMSKALKWHDLYYKANRRVIVEIADFNDFQHCIQFNQEHHDEILRIQKDFIAQKQQQRQPRHMALLDEFERSQQNNHHQQQHHHNYQQDHGYHHPASHRMGSKSYSLPVNESSHIRRLSFEAQLHPHQQSHEQRIKDPGFDHGLNSHQRVAPSTSQYPTHGQPRRTLFPALEKPQLSSPTPAAVPLSQPAQVQTQAPPAKPKPNPFGAAKPVDTLSKQEEIEKRLINLNKTTVQTLGDKEDVVIETTIKKFHESGSPTIRRTSFGSGRSSTEKRPSVSILRKDSIDQQQQQPGYQQKVQPVHPQPQKPQPQQPSGQSPLLVPASVSPSSYPSNGTGKSLAQLLSEQSDMMSGSPTGGKRTPRNNSNGKPTPVAKPIILKKKTPSSPPTQQIDLTVKEGEYLKQEEEKEKVKEETREVEGIETRLEKLDIQDQAINGKNEVIARSDAIPEPEELPDDRPNFKNLDQLVQKRNNSRNSSSSSGSRTHAKGFDNNDTEQQQHYFRKSYNQDDGEEEHDPSTTTSSYRGRGRGRSRGRGGRGGRGGYYRGASSRGGYYRGGRGGSGSGAGNFNLHYVRSKQPSEENTA